MNGVNRRPVIIALNGVIPVKKVLDSHQLTPHRLTSGPSAAEVKARLFPEAPTLVVLDTAGRRVGTWVGLLSRAQEAEVLARIR